MLSSSQNAIAAVILAPGASTRMGTPKQLLLYQVLQSTFLKERLM
ncbi:MAG: hypothetical protein ACRC2S_24105 [Waterburya sp.]